MHVCFDIRKVDLQAFEKPVVTLGSFDGVHLGHQAILKRLIEKSREKKRKAVVVTYEPHPQSVVAPHAPPPLLTILQEKLAFLEKQGVEETVVMNFDEQLKECPAEKFVEEILVGRLDVGDLVVGEDHAFGKNREGKIELLKKASRDYNFSLEVVSALHVDGIRVSSTWIRKELKYGDFARAITMLGHGYPLSGTVIRGKGRGKSLEYPTLNLRIHPRKLLPQDGVYSARVQLEGKSYVGMMYIGPKPTFGDDTRSVEVHVLGWEREVVDSPVKLFVESWIRKPMKFTDPQHLRDQLRSDEKRIKELFQIN